MLFQVAEVRFDGTLRVYSGCTFDNAYEAESLAYELSKACKANFTVRQIRRYNYEK